jgi:hypothetical protein
MDLLGFSKITVRLTGRKAILITLFFLLIWFTGYMAGAEVTRIWGYSRLYFRAGT